MLIVLLNFLIAIVSESYAKVNEQQQVLGYQRKSELNKETLLIKQNLLKLCPCCAKSQSFEIFMIEEQAKPGFEEDDEVLQNL